MIWKRGWIFLQYKFSMHINMLHQNLFYTSSTFFHSKTFNSAFPGCQESTHRLLLFTHLLASLGLHQYLGSFSHFEHFPTSICCYNIVNSMLEICVIGLHGKDMFCTSTAFSPSKPTEHFLMPRPLFLGAILDSKSPKPLIETNTKETWYDVRFQLNLHPK